ncbi:unnamed protein product, partial [Mesorhabditis spiculigera]
MDLGRLTKNVSNIFNSVTASAQEDYDPMVGKQLTANNVRYTIRKKIGAGGFADVYSAQDATGNWFAIKILRAHDAEAQESARIEIALCQKLTANPSFLKFVHSGQKDMENGRGKEYTIITELCTGGNVFELLQSGNLTHEQIVRVIYAAAKGIAHMHELGFTNRDVKLENLLIDANGRVKLCDFGSATRETHQPYDGWPLAQRTAVEESFQKYTTPMYRAPEILETYSNYPIGNALDVWALGCVLYYLCFRVHPFEDSAVTRICRVQIMPPREASVVPNELFKGLIMPCLNPDPRQRPTAQDFVQQIATFAKALQVNPEGPVAAAKKLDRPVSPNPPQRSAANAPPRPPPATQSRPTEESASAMIGALKGSGMSLFKNFKEKTAAVVSTVQSTYGSKGPTFISVTKRVHLAPILEGVPEPLAYSAEQSLKEAICQRGHPFLMVNLSKR